MGGRLLEGPAIAERTLDWRDELGRWLKPFLARLGHKARLIMPAFFPKALYKARARIEQAVGKLKRFKRIALRCEKTAQNDGSFVALALGFILIKSVHTA